MQLAGLALGLAQQAAAQVERSAERLASAAPSAAAAAAGSGAPQDVVDLSAEMVALMQAQRMNEAAVALIRAGDEMER